jgi:hypothetical protein
VLVFVARRLLAESVALVLVTREPSEELLGFPELVVEGLRNGDARALLGSVLHVPLDERVRERIVAETRGNPLVWRAASRLEVGVLARPTPTDCSRSARA